MNNLKFYHWLIIGFIGIVIVGLGIGYVVDRSKNKSVQGTETQISSPKVETPKTEVKNDESKVVESTTEQVNDSTEKSNNNSSVVNEPTDTKSTSQNTPSEPIIENAPPAPVPTPTPIPAKTCDVGAKENLLAWYDEKISAENNRYTQEVAAIREDFSRRGMGCSASGMGPQSGSCQVAVDQATTTHNYNISTIGYWLQSELSKINCSN